MQLVTRAQWGAKPSRYKLVSISGTDGVKVHYEGTPVPASLLTDHAKCAPRMRALQASHLANRAEDYSDIAYNYVVCPHGSVFEGRGLKKKTGANGNSALNSRHYAVCAMVGSQGLTEPTDAQLHGIRDAIELLREDGGAGNEIKGHRDGYATSCPGGPLYAWVQAGAPRPDGSPNPGGGGAVVSLADVVAAARLDPPAPDGHLTNPGAVVLLERALVAEDLLDERWADGSFGTKTLTAYRRWQEECGYSGADADGIPGEASLRRLGERHGFAVTA